MTDAETLAIAAVLVGGACHSATGFGFALVAAPLVAAALPPEEAITSLLALGILTSALTLLTEARIPEPLWPDAGRILGWGTAGALAGTFLLARLDATALQLLVTASVLAALLTRALANRRNAMGSDPSGSDPRGPGRRVSIAGLAAGALTTTTSANGPPLLLYLLERRVGAARMRDTLSVLFIGFGTIGMAALAVGDADLAFPDGAVIAALPAAAAAGHLAGRPLFARLAEGRYDQVVTVLLLASVLAGAVVALA